MAGAFTLPRAASEASRTQVEIRLGGFALPSRISFLPVDIQTSSSNTDSVTSEGLFPKHVLPRLNGAEVALHKDTMKPLTFDRVSIFSD
jgi:hypothetical protein